MEELNAMLSTLHLVYPPVSSFEADVLKDDPQVEALLRTSDFYMIGSRAEALIDAAEISEEAASARLTLSGQDKYGNTLSASAFLDIARLAASIGGLPETYFVDGGPKYIRFWPGTEEEAGVGESAPFAWFTTDKLIHDRGRGVPGISGIDNYREFATYELLYVGIAKKTDTFERLFQGAHHARQKMLSREWPRRIGARVTDELILFAFNLQPITFRTLASGDQLTEMSDDVWQAYRKKVVIDGEKAFVHWLDPKYNVTKFANYPKSLDGLYGHGHTRYGFVIAENLTFTSGGTTMRGSWNATLQLFDDHADMIAITGDAVELFAGREDHARNLASPPSA